MNTINMRHSVRSMTALSNDQLRAVAPSVFAMEPWHRMSDKYAFIPTIAVIERMREEGFQPVQAMQSRTRIEGKGDFTKHLIRFRDMRQGDQPLTRQLGVVYPELVLTNSHDGASAYKLDSGLFRLVCTNGMVVGDGVVNHISVRHTGSPDGVINASFEVIDQMPKVIDSVENFQRLRLEAPQAEVFATAALQLRYDEGEAPITPAQVLQPRRMEDSTPTLWNTFNRAQEALVGGGIRGRSAETRRRLRTRPVEGITENTKLNKALWTLAEEMRKLMS
jgi:hypothetical protein